MLATAVIETIDHEPVRRTCTLSDECVIEPGTAMDYKGLAAYHYRSTGFPPAVKQVYRARHVPTGRTVGAVVYASPSLNLKIRNDIFGDRYKGSGGPILRQIRASRLNREMELIIRTVVHPTFRGCGLGQRLQAETLPRRPVLYVEASTAMGAVNPFFERAGMIAVDVAQPAFTSRVVGALRSVGLKDHEIGNWKRIVAKLESLPAERRAWLWREMKNYATRWIRSRTNRAIELTPEDCARRIATNATTRTCYYLWVNPNAEKQDKDVLRHAASRARTSSGTDDART